MGRYELVFHAAAYLGAQGTFLPDPPFLDEIVIAFGLADNEAHYHVPLLLSPSSLATHLSVLAEPPCAAISVSLHS